MRTVLALLFFFTTSFSQQYVLICRSSSAYAYHNTMCRGLRQCRHMVEKITLGEAVKSRRKPCGYCYRPAAASSGITGAYTTPPAMSGQCQAITKKGTRCSRAARSGGYCWQHGG